MTINVTDRDQIFRKKRVQQQLQQNDCLVENHQQADESNQTVQVQIEPLLIIKVIEEQMQNMKSKNIDLVRQSVLYFKRIALQNTTNSKQAQDAQYQQKEDNLRILVDQNIIFELIELFNSTLSADGKYMLPFDISGNALHILAIIASGNESFINSILNKNGLTIFKNYAFLMIEEPYLISSAFLGLVNLSSLERKTVRQHLKTTGLLEHIQFLVSNKQEQQICSFYSILIFSANRINSLEISEEWKKVIENGAWLVSVLCFDPPESDEDLMQLNKALPFFIFCLNLKNPKVVKDIIWIMDICLTQLPQKYPGNDFAKNLISLGLSEAFNNTIKIDKVKVKAQTFRGINKLMKLSPIEEIDKIYTSSQIEHLIPVLKSKLIHNQYYALNYINELCYQNRFQDILMNQQILSLIISIVDTNQHEKFYQLILQSVLKIFELGNKSDIKIIFESGMLSILQHTLIYTTEGEQSAPQNIVLSLQILDQACKYAQTSKQCRGRIQNLCLENLLDNLQIHPLEKIYNLSFDIIMKYFEEA